MVWKSNYLLEDLYNKRSKSENQIDYIISWRVAIHLPKLSCELALKTDSGQVSFPKLWSKQHKN